MPEDLESEQPTNVNDTSATSTGGKLLLTFCTPPEDGSPYRHTTIRFPSSFQEARAAALKAFAAYIPGGVEAISLRQVIRRTDGQYVWGIIPEDDWGTLLEKVGEEVGVFLPEINPETIPYRRVEPPKRLVHLWWYDDNKYLHQDVKAVGSLKECRALAQSLTVTKSAVKKSAVCYDLRMVGSDADRALYKNRVDNGALWNYLTDEATFNRLLFSNPEPMWIRFF